MVLNPQTEDHLKQLLLQDQPITRVVNFTYFRAIMIGHVLRIQRTMSLLRLSPCTSRSMNGAEEVVKISDIFGTSPASYRARKISPRNPRLLQPRVLENGSWTRKTDPTTFGHEQL
jgi:hypothetical protein